MANVLEIIFGVKNAGLKAGMAEAKHHVAEFKKEVNAQFAEVGTTLLGALAAGGLAEFGHSLFELAGHIKNTAESLNLTTEEFQRVEFAMTRGKAKAEDFENAFGKLIASSEQAKAGNVGLVEAYGRLGVTWEDLNTLSPLQIFYKITGAVKDSSDPSRTFADILDVMGKKGKLLLPQMKEGAAGIQQVGSSATIAGQEAIDAADKIETRWNDMLRNIKSAALEELPKAITVLKASIGLLAELKDAAVAVPQFLFERARAAAAAPSTSYPANPANPTGMTVNGVPVDMTPVPRTEIVPPASKEESIARGRKMLADLNAELVEGGEDARIRDRIAKVQAEIDLQSQELTPSPELLKATRPLEEQLPSPLFRPDLVSLIPRAGTGAAETAAKVAAAAQNVTESPVARRDRKEAEALAEIRRRSNRELMTDDEKLIDLDSEREERARKIGWLEDQISKGKEGQVQWAKDELAEEKKKSAEMDGQIKKLDIMAGKTRGDLTQESLEKGRAARRAARGIGGTEEEEAAQEAARGKRAEERRTREEARGAAHREALDQAAADAAAAEAAGKSVEELRREREFGAAFGPRKAEEPTAAEQKREREFEKAFHPERLPQVPEKPQPQKPPDASEQMAKAVETAVLKLGKEGVLNEIKEKVSPGLTAK